MPFPFVLEIQAMITRLEPCIPPVWARDGHSQTLWGHFLPSIKPRVHAEQVRIPLPDGDILIGELFRGESRFVVLLFHGLTGSNESTYIARSTVIAQEQGHTVLQINHRGCGRLRTLAKRPYHSGRGEDISEVVAFSRQLFPDKKHIAIGFSLSANALLLLLSGVRGQHKPDMAMAVNGPLDLKSCAELLQQGMNRIYDISFVQACKEDIYFKQRNKLLSSRHKISWTNKLSDIDRMYTAPEGGFKSAEHYYETCSAGPHLEKITTPTFILTAKDDPFITWKPYLNAANNPHVQLHIEEVGGHLGYLSAHKSPWKYERWLDYAVREVLTAFTR